MSAFFNSGAYHVRTALLITVIIAGLSITGCKNKSDNSTGDNKMSPGQQARLYLQENHLDEAEAAFQKAIQVSPDDISNYIGLTRLYLLQKNYDGAEEQAKAGLKIKPDDQDLKLILADAYHKK
ncbi:MAG TPA: tetratricopeptide repeat protein, partial [Mucilaginibacter sp.]|nr:tetratricopeptide repeat protein [Mucilaginibacter sp.]